MARHRTYPIAFKRQIAQECLSGEVSLHGLAKRHDICRNLIRIWVEKYESGEFDGEIEAANLLGQYEARIAALEGLVGRSRSRTTFSKKHRGSRARPKKPDPP
jgi:transposase-like protein